MALAAADESTIVESTEEVRALHEVSGVEMRGGGGGLL